MHKYLQKFWAWWKWEVNQGPPECKVKVLTSESLHTIMRIAFIIEQIFKSSKSNATPKFMFFHLLLAYKSNHHENRHEASYILHLDYVGNT
jgi:hypothetical protein